MLDTTKALPMLESLSSPPRLAIYRLLVKTGPDGLVAGEIAASLELAPSRLSFHLKDMTRAGLITATSEGRYQRYRLRVGAMVELIDFLSADCCAGRPELCGVVALAPACCTPTDCQETP